MIILDYTTGIELKRGFVWIEQHENYVIKWPCCHVDECPNGICVGKNKKYCHPHMFEKGMESIEELKGEIRDER